MESSEGGNQEPLKPQEKVSRRGFLKGAAAIGAALGLQAATGENVLARPIGPEGEEIKPVKMLTPDKVNGQLNREYYVGVFPQPREVSTQQELEDWNKSRARKLIREDGSVVVEAEVDPALFFSPDFLISGNYSAIQLELYTNTTPKKMEIPLDRIAKILTYCGVKPNPETGKYEGGLIPFYCTNAPDLQGNDNVLYVPGHKFSQYKYERGHTYPEWSSKTGGDESFSVKGITPSRSLSFQKDGSVKVVDSKIESWSATFREDGYKGKDQTGSFHMTTEGLAKSQY